LDGWWRLEIGTQKPSQKSIKCWSGRVASTLLWYHPCRAPPRHPWVRWARPPAHQPPTLCTFPPPCHIAAGCHHAVCVHGCAAAPGGPWAKPTRRAHNAGPSTGWGGWYCPRLRRRVRGVRVEAGALGVRAPFFLCGSQSGTSVDAQCAARGPNGTRLGRQLRASPLGSFRNVQANLTPPRRPALLLSVRVGVGPPAPP
jgi:hypothetical protein